MSFTSGSRITKHEIMRRVGVRRHAPPACFVSIIIALQPVSSIGVERLTPSRADGAVPAAMFELTGRLCLAHDGCGSLTVRVVKH